MGCCDPHVFLLPLMSYNYTAIEKAKQCIFFYTAYAQTVKNSTVCIADHKPNTL
jgi:hypothetical protein